MTHGTALLGEILAHPTADPPRLVYADHLEQEGELDRANFIRHQVRRASLPAWHVDAVKLDLIERALLAKHELAWRAALPSLAEVTWGPFSRGFVGTAAFASMPAFEEHFDEVSSKSPVSNVIVRWPTGAKPSKIGALETVDELTLHGTVMRPELLKWLAGCALLSTVRTLGLVDSSLRSGLPHLLKSPHLGSLTTLRIPEHHLGNGIAKLATASLPSLVALDLSAGEDEGYSSGRHYASPAVTSKGVDELAGWEGLGRIHSLDLSGAKLGLLGLHNLLVSTQTRALKVLRLRAIKDGDWDMDDSLGAFKAGPAGTLDELDVSDNDLDPEGAFHLAEAKALRELKVLRLANVRSRAFDRLAKASWVRSLRVLACHDQPLPHLLPRAEQLHTLAITPSATPLATIVQALAAHPPPALLALDLSAARVDDAGLDALAKLRLPTLVSLALPRVPGAVSPEAIGRLAASRLGDQLVSFHCGLADFERLPPARALVAGEGEW